MAVGNARNESQFFALCDRQQNSIIDCDQSQVLIGETDQLSGLKRSFWERKNLPDLVQAHKFDVVFTPYQVSSVKSQAKSVLMLRNMEPFFFHRYRYSWKTRLRNAVLKRSTIRSVKSADHVIAVSDFAQMQLVDKLAIPPDNVTRIYHGRDLFFAETASDESTIKETVGFDLIQTPYLLTCGSLLPYRRCEDVISAFHEIPNIQSKNLKLIVAGDGRDDRYKKKLHGLVSELDLQKQVVFTGHVTKQIIRSLYQHAELVILATEIEACPNIAIECMSSGAAILASDSLPLPEIIGKSNARFFQARNVSQLATEICELLENSNETQQLKLAARQQANAYCWEKCAESTVQLLEKI